jgi:hypothetical protein
MILRYLANEDVSRKPTIYGHLPSHHEDKLDRSPYGASYARACLNCDIYSAGYILKPHGMFVKLLGDAADASPLKPSMLRFQRFEHLGNCFGFDDALL